MCGVREVCALCDVKMGACITYFVFCYMCINDMFVKNRDSNVQGANKGVCITVNLVTCVSLLYM